MNRVTMALALATVSIAAGATACSSVNSTDMPTTPVAQQEVQAPAAVKVPDGNTVSASFEGKGVQVYQCTDKAWTLLEPAATLTDPKQDDKSVALHFKGPVWVSTTDGSEVGATPVPNASVKHADAVPELLLKANENHGDGTFSKVTFVQRLNTVGGLAPQGPCTTDAQQSVGYSAIYQFWVAAK